VDREALIFWIQSNYHAEQMSNELFKINLQIGDNRSQLVFVSVWQDNFTVFSPIAEYSPQTAGQVLEFISESGVVGLTVFSGMYCISNSSLTLNGPSLDDWITYIGETADDYESHLSGGQNNL
jgi:hypothetical protein